MHTSASIANKRLLQILCMPITVLRGIWTKERDAWMLSRARVFFWGFLLWGFGLIFFNSSLLSAIFVFCLFSSLLTLLCGMLNADERKLFGMSISHFSLAHLGIGCPNWTRNKPAVGYPIISTELSGAVFLYLITFFSHGDLHLLNILLTISKKFCNYCVMYTIAIITDLFTEREIKTRLLMSL